MDPERLVGLVVTLQRQLQESNQRLDESKRRIEELEKKLGGSATAKTTEPFRCGRKSSGSGHGGRSRESGNGRCGEGGSRRRTRSRWPSGRKRCFRPASPRAIAGCRTRGRWRLENGRAVLVAYEVYRGPKNRFGVIPGTLERSGFGYEIILAIAYQVYIVGLSFDKVCLLMNFFQNLRLRKSQATRS